MLLKFTAPMLLRGLNPYILVNKKQAYSLKSGWKKPMPVLVQINGKPTPPWRINMMPVGNGDFYLYLHGDVRKASKTQVGDIVTVHISFDKDYISGSLHSLPEWFASALEKNLQ